MTKIQPPDTDKKRRGAFYRYRKRPSGGAGLTKIQPAAGYGQKRRGAFYRHRKGPSGWVCLWVSPGPGVTPGSGTAAARTETQLARLVSWCEQPEMDEDEATIEDKDQHAPGPHTQHISPRRNDRVRPHTRGGRPHRSGARPTARPQQQQQHQ